MRLDDPVPAAVEIGFLTGAAIIQATAWATLCRSASARNCCKDDASDVVEIGMIPKLVTLIVTTAGRWCELEQKLEIVTELVVEVVEDVAPFSTIVSLLIVCSKNILGL